MPRHDLPPWADPAYTARLDAKSTRALAHPIRIKILGILRMEGPATSTTIANRLNLNTGTTSYHLRQLAAYGFIVEDADRGIGRERWWKAAHAVTVMDRESINDDETSEAFIRAVGQIYTEKIQQAIDEYATLPESWRGVGTFSDVVLVLTPEEADQLKTDLFEVMSRYRRHDPADPAPASPGSARVVAQLQIFPDARSIE